MKAVQDEYRRRSMDELCEDALRILRDANGPVRCGYIGEQLFFDAIHRGSAPFARIAGKVMQQLQREGRASWDPGPRGSFGGWICATRRRA